ncbi:MAG: hypothetical protein H0X41_11070 [Chitinophagaceae bacterium]|nr:hypothetical protein [Chitinophagaceae bacterium]
MQVKISVTISNAVGGNVHIVLRGPEGTQQYDEDTMTGNNEKTFDLSPGTYIISAHAYTGGKLNLRVIAGAAKLINREASGPDAFILSTFDV